MASVTPSHTRLLEGEAMLYTWTLTQADNEGLAIDAFEYGDRTVQIGAAGSTGFDGATVLLQGSNDGQNWFTLTDPQGNGISKGAAALETVMEVPRHTRVSSSGGGAAQSVPVYLFCRRTRR